MNNRTGVVMQVKGSTAMLMTPTGEFINVKIKKHLPKIGEEFVGEVVKSLPLHRYLTAAASLFFILFIGSGITAYCTPAATVRVDINPSLELKLNRWHRVLSAVALNEDGSKLLSSLHLRNNSLNDSLNKIVDEAKRDNYIDSQYATSGKDITITIEQNKKDIEFDFSTFEQHLNKDNLKLQIQDDTQDPITINGAGAQDTKSSVSDNKSENDKKPASDSSESLGKDTVNPADHNDVPFTPPGQEKKETTNDQKNTKMNPPGLSQKKNTQDASFPSSTDTLNQDNSAKQDNNSNGNSQKGEKSNHKDKEEKDDKKSNPENKSHGKKDE